MEKNNFFKHRFLPILSVFLFVAFVFTTNVFASFDFAVDGKSYSYPDFPEPSVNFSKDKFVIFTDINNSTYLCYIDNSFDGQINWCGNSLYYGNHSTSYTFPTYLLSGDSWVYMFSRTSHDNAQFNFIYSTENIYDGSGNVFFQKPLLEITETLVVETNKAQIAEQLRTMIVGFLKYLIVLVISVIAFWKGWQFLLTQLKKA